MAEAPATEAPATEAPAESSGDDGGEQAPSRTRNAASSVGSSAKSYTTNTSAARNISLAMFFAVGFALLGHEIEGKKNPPGTNGITEGGRILLGGFAGGTILIGVSKLGEGAAELAQGIALITAASSVLVFGGPVWTALGSLFGKTVTTGGTGNTGTTGATGTTGTTGTTGPTDGGANFTLTPAETAQALGTPTTGNTP